MTLKLSAHIDAENLAFTSAVKQQLKNLSAYSAVACEWLMMEHFQFSVKNPHFLATAATMTKQLSNPDITVELDRNFNEEKSHAAIYKKALMEVGTDVEKRSEFLPTTAFLLSIDQLIAMSPAITLGAMYATETAAIFEHEVCWDIGKATVTQRGLPWEGSRLKAFHDMHLNGVEQSHKDGLAIFVDDHENAAIDEVLMGANKAIAAMKLWWREMLAAARKL